MLCWVGGLAAALALLVLWYEAPVAGSLYPDCPFHAATGLHCPGCGTLRSAHALLHGDLRQAAAYNIVTLICCVVLPLGLVVRRIPAVAERLEFEPRLRARLSLAVLVAILAFWFLRNLPISPFDLLAPHERRAG